MSRALVLVDLHNDRFAGGAAPVAGAEEAARVSGLILEAFRDSAEPIFFLRPAGGEINDAVAPEGEPEIETTGGDGFAGTDLEAQLRATGASELVVVGLIDDTVRAADELGFSVVVADDATASPDGDFDAFVARLGEHARIVASHELI